MDKMLLELYLTDIAEGVLRAVATIEAKHTNWEVGAIGITVRCVLKPVKERDGTLRVYADIDEPAGVPMSEIPLPIRRKADG